jgi:acetoin utilization deacetylase AcuC-like enzyme
VKLAIADDDIFLEHRSDEAHPERPQRLEAARLGLQGSRWLTQPEAADEVVHVVARDATFEELRRVHSASHIERLEAARGRTGHFDADTYYSPRSQPAAVRAAGAGLQLVEALNEGADYALGLLRPPGHHATADRVMGFCLLNNIAVAARHTQRVAPGRVLILDWDVHHGNGTQDIFYEDAGVLYVSLHQSPQYPGTGSLREQGAGKGVGFNVNVPLPAGSDDAVYFRAFEQIVQPVVRQFQPEWLLVSAGYDAHQRDPLGGMALTSEAFGTMTRQLLEGVSERGRGRTLFLLEGGYDLEGVAGGVQATLNALLDDQPLKTPELPQRSPDSVRQAVLAHRAHWALPTED